jgi:hypothetical protein
MKHIQLFLFSLLFMNVALGATWVPISADGRMFVDIDEQNIKRIGNTSVVWQKLIYDPGSKREIDGQQVTESQNQVSIDCSNNTYQLLNGIYFNNSQILETTVFPLEPINIVKFKSNSASDGAKKLTCLSSQLSKTKAVESAATQKDTSRIYLECTYLIAKEVKTIEQVIDLNTSTINGRAAVITDSEISWEGDKKTTKGTISRQTGVSQVITLVDNPSFKAGEVTISGKCQQKTQKLF